MSPSAVQNMARHNRPWLSLLSFVVLCCPLLSFLIPSCPFLVLSSTFAIIDRVTFTEWKEMISTPFYQTVYQSLVWIDNNKSGDVTLFSKWALSSRPTIYLGSWKWWVIIWNLVPMLSWVGFLMLTHTYRVNNMHSKYSTS